MYKIYRRGERGVQKSFSRIEPQVILEALNISCYFCHFCCNNVQAKMPRPFFSLIQADQPEKWEKMMVYNEKQI